MKPIKWNKEKNEWLKKYRNVSFEEIDKIIKENKVLEITDHPNQKKYPRQKIYIVRFNNYAYLVPFVEDESKIFLKTIIPSRKTTKTYLKGRENNERL